MGWISIYVVEFYKIDRIGFKSLKINKSTNQKKKEKIKKKKCDGKFSRFLAGKIYAMLAAKVINSVRSM